ncbi:MAG: CHAT domain-containing protein [Pseudanabaena sp.]
MSSPSWKVLLVLLLSGIAALEHNNLALSTPTTPSYSSNQSDPPYHDNIFPNGGGLRDRLLGVLGNRFSKVPAGLASHRRAGDYFNRNQLEDAQYAIEQSYNDEHRYYSNENINPSPMSLSVAQTTLLRSEKITESATALVYPVIFPDRLEILVIPSSGKPFRKVVTEAHEVDILSEAQDFVSNIRDVSSTDYLASAQTLYNWIVRPIDADLQAANIKTLVFVMDGPLRVIPIAALHDGKDFLVQKYAIATVPSMGMVNLKLRDRRRNSILVMGLTDAMQGLSALPSVEVEVNTIATQVLQGDAFLNQSFTIENLKTQRKKQNYGIVHLATHAKFVSNTINGAFIQKTNERLYLDQLNSFNLGSEPIEMLTLSACQTAVGKNLGLGGVAAQYGAKSVLASLWTVSDTGTTPLMLSFYHNYPTAKSKAIALQQTQIALLTGTVRIEGQQIQGIPNLSAVTLKQLNQAIDLKHPYFWASFILVGNWL